MRKSFLLLSFALALLPMVTLADNLYIVENGANKISKYTTTGAAVNDSLVTGLNNPTDLALDGRGNLFVANLGSEKISEFTTSGATVNVDLITNLTLATSNPRGLAMEGGTNLFVAYINGHGIGRYTISNGVVTVGSASFISGLGFPFALAISEGNIYMVNSVSFDNKISKFTTAGATVNGSLITGLSPFSVAVDGTNLFVSSFSDNKILKYTTSGAIINTNFIIGLGGACGIAVDGKGNLYVANFNTGTIGKYDANSGAVINAALISGLNTPLNLELEVAAPVLSIARQAGNVVVSWPNIGNFLLQTNVNLTTTNWSVHTNVILLNGTNSATLPAASRSLFFRLFGTQ